jgi:hypothetical protein
MSPMVILVLLVAFYVLGAYPLQRIAQATSDHGQDAWQAWVPVMNIVLMCRIAGVSAWLTLLILLGIIPFFGSLIVLGFTVTLCVKIGERFQHGGLGWLAGLLPLIGAWVLAFNIETETAAY